MPTVATKAACPRANEAAIYSRILSLSFREWGIRDCLKSSWVRSQQYILVAHKTTIELLWPRCVPLQSSVSTTIRTFQTVSEAAFSETGLPVYSVHTYQVQADRFLRGLSSGFFFGSDYYTVSRGSVLPEA